MCGSSSPAGGPLLMRFPMKWQSRLVRPINSSCDYRHHYAAAEGAGFADVTRFIAKLTRSRSPNTRQLYMRNIMSIPVTKDDQATYVGAVDKTNSVSKMKN